LHSRRQKNAKNHYYWAGSLVFSYQLIWDVLSFPEISESTISLMDIDEERLNLIAQLAQKMVDEMIKAEAKYLPEV